MMEKLTLEQLRAVLEARKLRQTVQTRALSRVERQSLQQLSKIIANVGDTEGSDVVSLPDLDAAASEEPLPDIPSEAILQEMRTRQKVLYGEDDRVEVISSKDMDRRHKARSVAAIVERRDLVALEDGQVSIGGTTLGDRYAALGKPLCTREAFRGQPCVAIGTAFLVAPTIVATAHHCLNEATVDHRCLVFDFETDAAGAVLTTFRNDQIYGIRRFLAGAFTVDAEDWALVELDRAVTDREPLALRSTGTASDNLPLYVIGHPAGLPKKIAGNAEIRVTLRPRTLSPISTPMAATPDCPCSTLCRMRSRRFSFVARATSCLWATATPRWSVRSPDVAARTAHASNRLHDFSKCKANLRIHQEPEWTYLSIFPWLPGPTARSICASPPADSR